jgi:glycolate oxidase iron-sulfur subunit
VPRDQGCCGALHAHNGDSARGERLATDLASRPGRIVSTAGGCAAHLATVAGRDRVLDYSEALLERGPPPGPIMIDGRPARIGLQDSCHLRNGLGVSATPRKVLAALGEYVEVPGAADCCGAAGTYAILRRRDSRRVLATKLAVLADLGLDFLVVVNPGCLRQLTTAVRRARLRTKVVHLAELVAAAQADRR